MYNRLILESNLKHPRDMKIEICADKQKGLLKLWVYSRIKFN